eukprot:CAMPEP_0202458788 /NCGR_PEP_ID=MMETSP1360-20130828/28137_1 /ASSEMBLY_ACC=CAM_ASM_000848 /TAXON_ID=515479 /ORGANISM="Licmophora paradoxa, Strain CCMP2313" /LENGTH=228 /DNA_ID=CAMNT_0049079513 /DNA_START=410 /DNA_END=1096 /DNA_ORIENTATION=+
MTSFQRQLNLYGFNRLTVGRDRGGYYHSMFLRGREFLAKCILRTRVKGTGGVKAQPNPETEPNFYVMPYVFKDVSSEEAYPATAAISRVLENDCLNSLAHAVPTTSIKPPARTSPDRDSLSSADTLMEMSKIFDECGFNASSDGDQSPGKEDIIKRCLGDLSSFASDSLPIMKASFGGTEPSKAYEMGENLEPTPITSMSEDMPRVPSGFVRFMRHPSQSSLIIAFGD